MSEKPSNQAGPQSGTNASHSPVQFISLMDIVIILRQRWIPGTCIGALLAVAFVMFFMSQPPQFEAEASMVVEFNTDKIVNVQEVVDSGVRNSNLFESVMNTHIERLKGRSMAQMVLESLSEEELKTLARLHSDPDEPELERELELENSVSFLLEKVLSISWLPDSQVIRIRIKLGNPELARTLANRYVEAYIRYQLDNRSQSTGHAVSFLDQQTIDLKSQLEAEEQALQEYRSQHDLVTIEQNQQIITERLSQLSTAITTTRVRLLGIDSRAQQIKEADGKTASLMNIPFVGGRAIIQKIDSELQTLQQQQRVLTARYYERHPRMIELADSIQSTEANLLQAIKQATQEILIEQKTANDELSSLHKELDEVEHEALALEKLSIEYRVLERKVEAQRKSFDMVTSRYNETHIAQQMSLTSIRLLDLAAKPKEPSWPDIKKVGLAGCMLFGFVFLGLPLGMEFLDNRLKSFSDIEDYVGKPIIGDIKLLKDMPDQEMARLAIGDDYKFSEPFDAMYGALRLQLGQIQTPLGLIVTSSIPSEGKTTVASNLAETLSKHQFKTLLVDCDLRRPSVHRYMGLPNTNGLLHWLRSNTPLPEDPLLEEALGIQPIEEGSSVYALPAGGSTKQASPVFKDPRFDQLISKLKQHFDIIIFDTPPVGLFHDATMVAEYADHTIFVARQHATTRQKVRHSVSLMDRSEAPVLGVVFNGVKNSAAASGYGGYGSYNSSGYGYQYGYSKDADQYQKYYEQG